MPGAPRIGFSIVDVRDVADLHIRAMTAAEAGGERFIAVARFLWMSEVAEVLRDRLGHRCCESPEAKRPRPGRARRWEYSTPGSARSSASSARKVEMSSGKAEAHLGWSPRPVEERSSIARRSLVNEKVVTMANVLCVLYDDPVDGYPPAYARDEVPTIERYHDGQSTPTPEALGFEPGELVGSVSGELGLREFLEERRAPADRHLRQGRPGLGLRARAARGGGRHLPALLARLPDGRADRQGAEAEARADRRHRLRPRRPAGGDRARPYGRRGDLLEQHQRRRARRDDDPRAGPQLHPLLPGGGRGRLEHRRLRLALLRPRGHAGRHRRRRAHRLGGPAPAEAVRGRPALHRSPPPAARGRGGARRHLPPRRGVDGRGLRRRHDQRAASPRDREPLRRARCSPG